MSFKSSISALALASALVAAPPAFAQLGISVGGDDGINVGVDLDTDDGLGIGADVGVGGDDGVNVGTDVGVGRDDELVGVDVDARAGAQGDSLLDTDVNVGVGGRDSLVGVDADARVLDNSDNGPLVDLGADATVGGDNSLVDANVNLGTGGTGGSLINLGGAQQAEALLSLVGQSNIVGVNLDAAIDDRRIIIVDIGESFSQDTIADIELALLNGEAAGVEDTRAAVSASVTLSSVLSRNGLSADDVIAVEIGEQGQTYVYVLADLEDGVGITADADLAGTDIADADVRLLQDDTLASADVDILPGDDSATDEPLVGVDAQIGTGTQGEGTDGLGVDANIGLGDQDVVDADVDLLGDDAAADAQIDILPGAGLGEGNGIDTGLDLSLDDQPIAALGLDVLDDSLLSGDLVILPVGGGDDDTANGGDDTGNGGDDTGNGGDDTGNGGDDTGNGGDDTGNGGDDTGNGGDDTGNGGGDTGNGGGDNGGGADNGGTGGVGTGGTETTADASTDATMPCPADIRGFLEATATGAELQQATSARVVMLTGCDLTGLFQTADFDRLRTVISSLPYAMAAIEASPADIDDVVSATVSGDTATIYALQ